MARKYMRRRASRQVGRQGLWFRHGVFGMDILNEGQGIYGSTVVYPELWERDNASIINQKRKGGPILSSLFGNIFYSWNYDANDIHVQPFLELLIYVDDVDADDITDLTSFYQKMDSKRVLHQSATQAQSNSIVANNASISGEAVAMVSKSFKLGKAKVALSGKVVKMIARTGIDASVGDINLFRNLATASGYITTP